MNELKEGAQIKTIYHNDEQSTTVGGIYYHNNSPGQGFTEQKFESIVVKMQPGQMSMVPWAEAKTDKGVVQLFNLSMCEGVQLAEQESDDGAL